MSLPDEISDSLRIRLNMFTQGGLKPDDPVVVKHVTDYIVALLNNDEVRRQADEESQTWACCKTLASGPHAHNCQANKP